MRTVTLIVLVVVMIGCAGCAQTWRGMALDSHGATGWWVESTMLSSQKAATRDIHREQRILNERIDNAGWLKEGLKRLQGTRVE